MTVHENPKPKSPKPKISPIEEAIGDRAKDLTAHEKFTKEYQTEPIGKIPDEPSPSEMLNLEELNRQTEERLRDEPEMETPLEVGVAIPLETPTPVLIQATPIPVSKPDPQPVIKTSSQESPPQKIEEIDEYQDAEKGPQFELKEEIGIRGCSLKSPAENAEKQEKTMAELLGQKMNEAAKLPAEDIELTALKKYIREDGFVLATVAFHIVTLCAQPMVTPSTTTWDFRDRASVPDMVLALLNQPGYLEGIWPSLRIVMGSNKGNAAWCAGITTTIAFFDVVRTLPAIKELNNEAENRI